MPPSPRGLTEEVTRHRLPNGLTVLVKEIHAAPVVAINTWVRAGYFNETDEEVGISHVIEHMFFKGTGRRPAPDQIATEVKSLGGELNAGTYYDFTQYYFVLPAAAFEQGLDIQSDALCDPLVDPDELARELEAIIQEGRRKLDNPGAFAAEKLHELAFRVHRIRRWRIGEEAALRGFTRDRLLDYYRRHYAAGNVILAVVGDVETARVLDSAARHLGGLPPGDGNLHGSDPEPAQEEFRFRLLTGDLKRAHLLLGFRSPPLFHEDELPMRILATVLGKGRSSRLHQEVKERSGLVDAVGAGTEVFADLGAFTVCAELDPGKAGEAAAAISGVLEGIRQSGPGPSEIEKARNAVESQYYFAQGDVLGVSTNLAYYESLGDYRLADEFVRRLQAVSPDDVHRCAQRYLRPESLSALAYVPEGPGDRESDAEALRRSLQRPPVGRAPALPEIPAAAHRAPADASRSRAEAPPRRLPLPGGATLLVEENPRLPVTNVVVLFRGGRVHETPDVGGITRLTLASMVKGTHHRDALRIAVEMESFGCSLERIFTDDYLGLSVGILSRFLPGGLDLLLDVIRNPTFPPEEMARERQVLLAAIESLQDQAMGYALTLLREAAYPGHPYALPPYGSAAALQSLDPSRLREWHRRTFRPDRMVVSVTGDRSAESVQAMFAERMEGWRMDPDRWPAPPPVPPLAGIVERAERRRRSQTFQILGFPGSDLLSDQKYPLDLLQNTVSGLGGTFFEAVRGRRGLAYVVAATHDARRLGGSFLVYLGTAPDKEEEARGILLEEVERIRAEGFRPEEIERSRAFTLGTYPIALQTNLARALSHAAAEIQERGMEEVRAYPDRIRGVAAAEVTDAARRYLTPDRYALGVLRGSG